MQKIATLKILNSAALIVVIIVNYLANALPINGVKTADISNKYFNQFAPATITFSIWAVIYTLIIGLIIWQFINTNEVKNKAISQISPYFIANCLLNVAWLFAWHYELFIPTIILMLAILYTLIQLNKIAISQMRSLTTNVHLKKLK